MLMAPLHEEHEQLLPHIEALRTAGDAVGRVGRDRLFALVDDALAFLVNQLIPHADAEDKAMYPVVAQLMGASSATATMSRDHVEVGRLTHELHDLRTRLETANGTMLDVQRDLRRVLYGLYAVVKLHFAKEEEVYVPVLEAGLSPSEADDLFFHMHAAARAAKTHAH